MEDSDVEYDYQNDVEYDYPSDDVEYEYPSDDVEYEYGYNTNDLIRNENKMINLYPENKIWMKQVFSLLKNNVKGNKYFVIWDIETPFRFFFVLLKNGLDNIGTFSLSVKNEESYFPYSPPELEWIDPELNFTDYFAIKYIESLRKDEWNICQKLEEVIDKIYEYVCHIKTEILKYDHQLCSYLYKISELSGIYPLTITSDLPKLGMLCINGIETVNKSKGVGYSEGNIETWNVDKWQRVKDNTYNILKDIYNHLSNTKINENDIENIKYSALIPYLIRLIKNSSSQEISKNSENYVVIYQIGDWLYDVLGKQDLHLYLKQTANEIKHINQQIEKNSESEYETMENNINENQIIILADRYEIEDKTDTQILNQDYENVMKPFQCNIIEDFNYHTFEKKEFVFISQNKWFKRIFTEWKDLHKSLPLHHDGSIFIRWSAESGKPQLFKILIFPSLSSPYGGGAYEFDMYIPADYPNTYPTIKFLTTGGGTVRFNPNLYNCGKVCLSLLGTWSGEKWNPEVSNIYQICVSILGLIFVEEPYFNEPGYQNSQGSEKGNIQSKYYNENIRIQNIKYGIIDQIKNPPKEFEDVIKKHYQINLDKIKKNISEWMEESKNPEIIKNLLNKLN